MNSMSDYLSNLNKQISRMNENKIIIEVADNFRKDTEKKEFSIKGIDKEENPKQYVIGTIRNVKNERFYRGDVNKPNKKLGIPAVRFRPSVFSAEPEDRGKIATLEGALRNTDKTTPFVAMTTDLRIARSFLEKRMEETGSKEGYIYEIVPETYMDTRKVLTGQRDKNPAREYGMNKNKEVLVAGRVKPKEIIFTQTIRENPDYKQSREPQIKEERERSEN